MRIVSLIICWLVTLLPFRAALSQGVSFDAFAKPHGMILCQGVRPQPSDSATIVYEVSDEATGIDARETRVGYDSIGTPVFLSVLATTQSADSAYAKVYLLRFSHPKAGAITIGSGPLSKPAGSLVAVPIASEFKMVKSIMTELDVEGAHSFAKEFWGRRCKPFRVDL